MVKMQTHSANPWLTENMSLFCSKYSSIQLKQRLLQKNSILLFNDITTIYMYPSKHGLPIPIPSSHARPTFRSVITIKNRTGHCHTSPCRLRQIVIRDHISDMFRTQLIGKFVLSARFTMSGQYNDNCRKPWMTERWWWSFRFKLTRRFRFQNILQMRISFHLYFTHTHQLAICVNAKTHIGLLQNDNVYAFLLLTN